MDKQLMINALIIQIKQLLNFPAKKKAGKLARKLGIEGEKILLSTFLESLDFKELLANPNNRDKILPKSKFEFFMKRFNESLTQSIFLDFFPSILEQIASNNMIKPFELLYELNKFFKFNNLQQIIIGLACSLSQNAELADDGLKFLRKGLQDYLSNGKILAIPDYAHHILISMLKTSDDFRDMSEELKFLTETITLSEKPPEFKPLCIGSKYHLHPADSIDSKQDNIPQKNVGNNFNLNPNNSSQSMNNYLSPHEILEEIQQMGINPINGFQEAFPEMGVLNEDEILEMVITMANSMNNLEDGGQRMIYTIYNSNRNNSLNKFRTKETQDKKTLNWNQELFIKACHESVQNLKWVNVLKKLDRPNLKFKDSKAFVSFLKFFQRCKKLSNFPFPSTLIFEPWNNLSSQIHFITMLFQTGQPDLIFWSELNKKFVVMDHNPTFKYNALNPPVLMFWGCLEMLELLITLSESEYFFQIRALFDFPLSKFPEMLLFGLAQMKQRLTSALLDELFSQLFPLYLLSHSNSISVLEALWRHNQNLMISAIFELYRKENSQLNLSRVLDITQEIKDSLIPIANCNEYSFSVSLGFLASKREFLHFENWITQRVKCVGDPFISAVLKYLDDNIVIQCAKNEKQEKAAQIFESILEKSQLSLETLVIIFDNLMVSSADKLSLKNKKKTKELYNEIIRFFPTLENSNENSKLEVDNAANTYYQRIYNEEISVSELVEILSKFKNSPNPTEKEIFACIIHYLFDEFRFHDDYPMKQLGITGKLYGMIINSRIIDSSPLLDLAINCVKFCLENKQSNNRFEFAKIALENFKSRVIDLPVYFTSLFNYETLCDKSPEILLEIKNLADNMGKSLDIKPEIIALLISKLDQKNKIMEKPLVSDDNSKKPKEVPTIIQEIAHPKLEEIIIREGAFSADFYNKHHKDRELSEEPKRVLEYPTPHIAQPVPQLPLNNHLHILSKTPEPQTQTSIETIEKKQPLVVIPPISNPVVDLSETPAPPEEVQNRITFLLNNLTSANFEEKANELKPHLESDSNLRWFAWTLVHKRVALENTHQNPMLPTYSALIGKLNKKILYNVMLKETYACINRFLILGSHEKILNQTKNILKNLGVWLGLLTLSREKPIVLKYLNIKNLLVDAFHKDKLSFVLPLVCKILEQSKGSTVFKLNNPWLSVILYLLNEIHDQDIKTNIRCEIHLLFQKLEYQSSPVISKFLTLLPRQNPKLLNMVQHKNINPNLPNPNLPNPSLNSNPNPNSNPNHNPHPNPNPNLNLNPIPKPPLVPMVPLAGGSGGGVGVVQQLKITQLPDYITIDEKNLAEFLKEGFDLKMIVAQAVEAAIKEIIPPVVSRSVTIALITTRQLALKDFSLENDERKILRGAHLIVQNLSGSLALVTCREPLRIALCESLKDGLQERGLGEEAIEKIVKITSLDNLDLGCALIKKAVIEKALEDVNTDQTIIEILKKRKLAREKGEQYYDEKYVRVTQFLPEQLRPQIGGLTEEQLKIYEDFGNVQKKGPQSPLGKKEEEGKEEEGEGKKIYKERVLEKLDIMLERVEQKIGDMIETTGDKQQRYLNYMNDFELFLTSINYFERVPNEVIKRILDYIFLKTKKIENIDFIIELLKNIKRKILPSVLNMDVLINNYISTLDKSKLTEEDRRMVEYSIRQITRTVLSSTDFFHDLQQYLRQVSKFFAVFDQSFNENVKEKFLEWMQISTEKQITVLIRDLERNIFSKGDEQRKKFFVYAIEISVNRSLESMENCPNINNDKIMDFSYIDALSKLITIILKTVNDSNKSSLLQIIFDALLVVLTKNHEFHKEKFNQRPFFKLLYNLIYDINRKDYDFEEKDINDLFSVFLDLFGKLSPLKFPGFAFSWLELISNNIFMPAILKVSEQNIKYHELLLDLFRFFKKIVNEYTLESEVLRTFYKGTLRILLVLLHDFAEFLSTFTYSLCEGIPDKFIQMKNIILAAFPKAMRPPDPFSVKNMDGIAELKELPKIFSKIFENRVHESGLRADLVNYFLNKNDIDLKSIIRKILSNDSASGSINVPLVNALMLYIPWTLFSKIRNYQTDLPKFSQYDAYSLLLKILMLENFELREVILNAVFNQISYPNIITNFYINFILIIFLEINNEIIHEHITRIFGERLSIEKPHPWGLIYAYIELIRNQKLQFKNKSYWKGSKLFEAISMRVFQMIVTPEQENH